MAKCVESTFQLSVRPDTYTAAPVGDIEIWALALDGSGVSRRLTYFNEYAGYGANNPVISSDGRKMAFGLRVRGAEHGNAEGMLICDFEKAPDARPSD